MVWVAYKGKKTTKLSKYMPEHLFFRTQLGAYIASLLISNMLSCIGYVMNISWLKDGEISTGEPIPFPFATPRIPAFRLTGIPRFKACFAQPKVRTRHAGGTLFACLTQSCFRRLGSSRGPRDGILHCSYRLAHLLHSYASQPSAMVHCLGCCYRWMDYHCAVWYVNSRCLAIFELKHLGYIIRICSLIHQLQVWSCVWDRWRFL